MRSQGIDGARVAPNASEPLALDAAHETERIAQGLRDVVWRKFKRKGAVVALSGGVDSSVCVGLAATALGPDRVLALILPERESSPSSSRLAYQVAEQFGVRVLEHEITAALAGVGCYEVRDQAIRSVFPEYGPGWKNKIAIAGGVEGGFNHFRLVVMDPTGRILEKRLPYSEFLQVVAAQNHKQRIRKTLEYHHADRLHYAVLGTPNRLEYELGFFVKNGDGSADVKPIAHLYKTQVYALARHLGLPGEICESTPTTDTYSLPQGQDEFFYGLPYDKMDVALWCLEHDLSNESAARLLDLDPGHVAHVYRDIRSKREAAAYLHAPPLLL